MNKILFMLRIIGYIVIGLSFNKHDINLVYVIVLAIVMEVTFFINRIVNKHNLSNESKKVVDNIKINIKDK